MIIVLSLLLIAVAYVFACASNKAAVNSKEETLSPKELEHYDQWSYTFGLAAYGFGWIGFISLFLAMMKAIFS